MRKFFYSITLLLVGMGVAKAQENFKEDLNFLTQYNKVIELTSNNGKSRLAIVPAYQGRIMTSSAKGVSGNSYGWINYDLIKSRKLEKQINAFGGEDRFWLGPEGGQYSLFFKPKTTFDFANWNTPAAIDTEGFETVKTTASSAEFKKVIKIQNYSGTNFTIDVNRKIRIFNAKEVEKELGVKLNDKLDFVGFESINKITNKSGFDWKKKKGLISIWILGMFNPSDETTIVVPIHKKPQITSDYFGEINSDRLQIKKDVVYFKGDGKSRSKIGVNPNNTRPVIGSYDAEKGILTLVKFNFNNDKDYVNSLWKLQDNPYSGDVINSYNDGPLENGGQIGPFYELETSSPAKELKKNASMVHEHKTFHFEGDLKELNALSMKVLGVSLITIQNSL